MSETKHLATRKPWLAGLLSSLLPGLGQLYNGQLKKAILLALLPWLFIGPILTGLMIYAPFHPPYNLILPFLLAISVLVAIVRDATRVARLRGDSYELRSYNKWYVYLALVLLYGFVLQPLGTDFIRHYLIQSFEMPAGSMVPTLLIGDDFLIDKSISWSGKVLQRGDIIVFKFPEDETKEFIKRVIGGPGDTVQLRNKIVYVNGAALDDETYTQRIDPGVLDGQVNPRDSFGPVTVPEESYFVMGDNRDQSLDSRFFGYVRRSKIMGKLVSVYWSWDDKNKYVRWDRIGQRFK